VGFAPGKSQYARPRAADGHPRALGNPADLLENRLAAWKKPCPEGLVQPVIHGPGKIIPVPGGPGGRQQGRAAQVVDRVFHWNFLRQGFPGILRAQFHSRHGHHGDHVRRKGGHPDEPEVSTIPAAYHHAAQTAGHHVVRVAFHGHHHGKKILLRQGAFAKLVGDGHSPHDGRGGTAEPPFHGNGVQGPETEPGRLHAPLPAGPLVAFDHSVAGHKGFLAAALPHHVDLVFP